MYDKNSRAHRCTCIFETFSHISIHSLIIPLMSFCFCSLAHFLFLYIRFSITFRRFTQIGEIQFLSIVVSGTAPLLGSHFNIKQPQ